MRVTQNLMFQNSSDAMQSKYQELQKVQERSLSGVEVNRPSDDPMAAFRIMTYSASVSQAKSLQETTTLAVSRLSLAEEKVTIMHDKFLDAEDLIMKLGNDYQAGLPSVLTAAADEALALYQDVLKHANSEMDGVPLFSGGQSEAPFSESNLGATTIRMRPVGELGFSTPASQGLTASVALNGSPPTADVPASVKVVYGDAGAISEVFVNGDQSTTLPTWIDSFTVTGGTPNNGDSFLFEMVPAYQGGSDERQIKISDTRAQDLPGNVSGSELVEGSDRTDGTNLLGVLTGLRGALERQDTQEVNAYLSLVHEGRAQVSDWQSITGIRQVQVQSANTALSNEEMLLKGTVADNREADLFEVLSELEQVTQSMQVMTTSERELLNTSLLDFIR